MKEYHRNEFGDLVPTKRKQERNREEIFNDVGNYLAAVPLHTYIPLARVYRETKAGGNRREERWVQDAMRAYESLGELTPGKPGASRQSGYFRHHKSETPPPPPPPIETLQTDPDEWDDLKRMLRKFLGID